MKTKKKDESAEKIAELTIKNKTGARGLRSIIEGVLQDLMFEMPSQNDVAEITITAQTVDCGKAVITHKK